MRALIRAYSASHPLATVVVIAIRWVLWFAAGHALGLAVVLVGLLLGLSVPVAMASAVLFEVSVFALGAHRPTSPARFVWVWIQGMAFRRRWPSAFAEAYVQPEFDRAAVFPGNYYSAPDGLRPVLVAPRLPLRPSAVGRSSMRWNVRPWSSQRFADNTAQVRRLARADDRVLRAELTRQTKPQKLVQHRRRWNLDVVFADPAHGPDDGHSAVGAGYTPAANGDDPGADSPLRRGRRSNNSLTHQQLDDRRRDNREQSTPRWRVIHDERVR